MRELFEALACGSIVLAFFAPGFVILFFATRKSRTSPRLCHRCQYPKRGSTSPTCPECGTPWQDERQRVGREGLEILGFLLLLFFFMVVLPMVIFGFLFIMAVAV